MNKIYFIFICLISCFSYAQVDNTYIPRSGIHYIHSYDNYLDYNLKNESFFNRNNLSLEEQKKFEFKTDFTLIFCVPFEVKDAFINAIKKDFLEDLQLNNYNVLVLPYKEEKFNYINSFNGQILNRPLIYLVVQNKEFIKEFKGVNWLKKEDFSYLNNQIFQIKLSNCNNEKFFADYKNVISELLSTYTLKYSYKDILKSIGQN